MMIELTERQRAILAAADEVQALDRSHRNCPAGPRYLRSQERLYAAIDKLTDVACQDEATTNPQTDTDGGAGA